MIFKGYTLVDGFAYTALTYPCNVQYAIIVKCKNVYDCEGPIYDIPYHSLEDYVAVIQKNRHKRQS